MAWTPVSGLPVQYQKSDGSLASGYYLKLYADGTTTAINMATDSTGGTLLDKCQINASGYPVNGSSAVFIPHSNQEYKIALYTNSTDADNDTIGSADWVIDDIPTFATNQVSVRVVDTKAALTALDATTFTSAETLGFSTKGDGGDFAAYFVSGDTSTETPFVFKDDANTGRWFVLLDNNVVNAKSVGVVGDGDGLGGGTDDATILQSCIDLAGGSIIILEPKIYKIGSRLTPKSNVTIRCPYGQATFDFTGVLGESSGESYCIYNTGISNFILEGVRVLGDVNYFSNNGFNTYGLRIDASNECHLRRVTFEKLEYGGHFRNGCSDCSMEKIIAKDCRYHSVGTIGTSGSPNVRITINDIYAYSTSTLFGGRYTGSNIATHAALSGLFVEETYDSEISNIKATNCHIGLRIENSCDNSISNIRCWQNWLSGMELYNKSERNQVNNVHCWDNNKSNQDATDSTLRGNDNTKCSGLNIEVSHNNSLTNIFVFQSPAKTIPFTSGSDEPSLGSKLQGTTSGATGRVRKIELTSGSWAGNDAAGTMHLVETSGTFNSSEVIQNVTTVVPYTSGGTEKPGIGDTLTGATSGATGEVLWASQQSQADWSGGSSVGNIYLINVTGTFNSSEALNNTTSGTSDIATTNGAATAADTDIATTNGAETAATGSGVGFQKYGVGLNIRNLTGIATADAFNTFVNIQAFNNDLNAFEDRGFYNQINNLNTSYSPYTRNA